MITILTIIATVVLVFTCAYLLVFVTKALGGIVITVNMAAPPNTSPTPGAVIDIAAQQVILDKAREQSTDVTQGIDNMLTELNMYMTGGKSDDKKQ